MFNVERGERASEDVVNEFEKNLEKEMEMAKVSKKEKRKYKKSQYKQKRGEAPQGVEGSPKAGKAGKGKKGKKEEEAEVVVGETEPDIEELISRMSQGGEGEDWDFKSHTKFLI